jgi:hypothetical protein
MLGVLLSFVCSGSLVKVHSLKVCRVPFKGVFYAYYTVQRVHYLGLIVACVHASVLKDSLE